VQKPQFALTPHLPQLPKPPNDWLWDL